MQSFTPSEPPTPCHSSTRPHVTRPISESSHQKKRRRPPPPLSVTSVFTPQRLPTNSGEFWQWPVTSWYLGEVGEDDVALAKERPFVDHVALATEHALKPLPTHYRLRWLEEDATLIAAQRSSERIVTAEPFGLLPYANTKQSDACVRPMSGVKRPSEEGNEGRKKLPRLSRRLSKRVCVQTPQTQVGTTNSAVATPSIASNEDTRAGLFVKTPASSISHQNVSKSCLSTPQRENGKLFVARDIAVVHASTNFTSANAVRIANKTQQNPVMQQCSPDVMCPTEAIPCNSVGKADSALQSCGPFRTDAAMKLAPKSDATLEEKVVVANDDDVLTKKFSPPSCKVQLQFLSSTELRLMGSLTYSIPVLATSREGDEKLKDGDSKYAFQANMSGVDNGACVDGMELHFRKADANFANTFNDSVVADELRSEISKQSTMLLALEDKARPLRGTLLDALQTEFDSQREFAGLLAEEKNIVARLKEIQQQKKTAKVAEKETAREMPNVNRRTSERRRSTSRARSVESRGHDLTGPRSRSRRIPRPSRKILEDMEDDDEVNEQQQHVTPLPDGGPSVLKTPLFKTRPLLTFEPVGSVSTPAENFSTEVIKPSSVEIPSATRVVPQRTTETITSHSEFDPARDPGLCSAPSPSDDGTAVGIAQSPCGIFPGESEENSKFPRVPSPVSPLQAATPQSQYGSFPEMKIALKIPEAHHLKAGLPLRSGGVGNSNGVLDR